MKPEESQPSNYGLNLTKEERQKDVRLVSGGMTQETEDLLKALNIVPNVPETKTLNYKHRSKQDANGVS